MSNFWQTFERGLDVLATLLKELSNARFGWKAIKLFDKNMPFWKVVVEGFVDDVEEVLELRGIWPILCPHNDHHGLLESVEPMSDSKDPRCFFEVEVGDWLEEV